MLPSPTRVAAGSLRALPRKPLSRALGKLARTAGPDKMLRTAVDIYCRAYGVDLTECEVPAGGYRTFDEFFTRRLKEGARPIDPDPTTIVSPADGRLEDCGPIDRGATFRVKGRTYTVSEMLDDGLAARDYEGGEFAVIYLSPRDYHRVHAPVSGPVLSVGHVPGTLYPVNRIGLEHVPKLFARNERVVVRQQAEQGTVATILVGAIGVGRISCSFDARVLTNSGRAPVATRYSPAQRPSLERGQELGIFHLGSTVVLFLPKDQRFTLVKAPGDSVRMGDALFRVGST